MSEHMILLQISSAQGPVECCKAVAHANACICEEAKKAAIKLQTIETVGGPAAGTTRSVLLSLEGEHAAALAKRWSGTVQWICSSSFRPTHKRRNWFIGINSFSTKEPLTFQTSDVVFEAMRSSGPGGQHVNKTESAIRATHVASGISVKVQTERSQHANKRIALLLISHKIQEQANTQLTQQRTQRWQQHHQLERGNPVLTFTGEQFKPL